MSCNRVAPVTLSERLRRLHRLPVRADGTRACSRMATGNALGEQLGLAGIWATSGNEPAARAVALLAIAGLPDTPANRQAVIDAHVGIAGAVRCAVVHAGGLH